jgi:hypothetical protein
VALSEGCVGDSNDSDSDRAQQPGPQGSPVVTTGSCAKREPFYGREYSGRPW